mgnify:CR=1 FL=1
MNQMKLLVFQAAAKEHIIYVRMLNDNADESVCYDCSNNRYLAIYNIIRCGFMEDEYKSWYKKVLSK